MYQPENRIDLSALTQKTEAVRQEIKKHIVGQDQLLTLLLTALIADGHVLIEGVPGVAKTQTARLLARTLDVQFKRIQFTPDLLPSDIVGTSVFHTQKSEFIFNKGPVFTNILLADEINRAPAKTQAALFEAMEERQVTADGITYPLEEPFMVLATQNPIDLEGTYRLPEAQIDRFLFKIVVPYPSLNEEVDILRRQHRRQGPIDIKQVKALMSAADLHELRQLATRIHVEEKLMHYIASITDLTRNNPDFYLAASPRASLAILEASKALAALHGRDFVSPDDIRFVAPHALTHRLILSADKEIEGIDSTTYIKSLIENVEVPR